MNILDIAIAKKLAGGGGGSGTDNYNDLSNLPKINDTTLSGNKSSSALGLQSEINSESKLASDLVDDTNQDNKFVTSTEKNTWNAKQNAIDADHKLSSDLVDDANKTNKFVTSTEKNTWNAKQNAIDSDHKLSSDLVDDANKTNKFVTSTEKNTWNAKQNAIDADHKLSSSLVSFTTAEAAALASGIDSSKVGQISTNQTNILSVEDMVCATEFSSSTAYAVGDMVTYEHKLYKFINAHQGAWSASDVQNYDLTRLESEDRAGLVECVDGGAKNKLQNKATSKTQNNVTFTVNADGEVTVSTTGAASANTTLSLTNAYIPNTFKGNIISGVPASTTSNTICMYIAYSSNGSSEAKAIYVNAATNPIHEILDYPYIQIFVLIYSGVTVSTALKFQPMICTKAAFGVSSKFVPYRPNYDLVAMLVPKTMYKTVNFSAANTWTYSNLSFTVPAGTVYLLIASISWNSGKPTGICISTTNTSNIGSADILAINEAANNGITCIYQMPSDQNVDKAVYVHVKNESATGSSPVRFTVIRIV